MAASSPDPPSPPLPEPGVPSGPLLDLRLALEKCSDVFLAAEHAVGCGVFKDEIVLDTLDRLYTILEDDPRRALTPVMNELVVVSEPENRFGAPCAHEAVIQYAVGVAMEIEWVIIRARKLNGEEVKVEFGKRPPKPLLREHLSAIRAKLNEQWENSQEHDGLLIACQIEATKAAEARPLKPAPRDRLTPVWDSTTRTLSYAEWRHPYKGNAKNQIRVFETFSERGWPDEVAKPNSLHDLSATLRDIGKSLGQQCPIIFTSNGNGTGIRWAIRPSQER